MTTVPLKASSSSSDELVVAMKDFPLPSNALKVNGGRIKASRNTTSSEKKIPSVIGKSAMAPPYQRRELRVKLHTTESFQCNWGTCVRCREQKKKVCHGS